ncbi:MAG: hypothetical protein FWC75_06875 [Oscillospiraceae bacterium]|nr:hypothetical protein [Oscillospiraceae bacterium]
MPSLHAILARSAMGASSWSDASVFNVKYVFTPRIRQYSSARANSSVEKFFAFFRALNSPNPKYIASAPFCTAAVTPSGEPAGYSISSTELTHKIKIETK